MAGLRKKKASNRIFLIHIKNFLHFTFGMTVHASSCVDPNSGTLSSQSRENLMQTTSYAIKSLLASNFCLYFSCFHSLFKNFDQALLFAEFAKNLFHCCTLCLSAMFLNCVPIIAVVPLDLSVFLMEYSLYTSNTNQISGLS